MTCFRNMAETGELSWDDISEAAESSVAAMTAGLQTYSQFAAAQSKIDIANAEKKYDAMLKAAEGNSTYPSLRRRRRRNLRG